MSAASLKANEPSMEEILASIRRIIADDSGTPPPPPDEAPELVTPEAVEDLDVLDLATVPEAAAPLIKPVDLEPLPQSVEMDEDVEFRLVEEPLIQPQSPPPPQPPRPAAIREVPLPAALDVEVEEALLSPEIGASVSSAFHALATTLVPQNGRTLEDIVKDMMRPMLKSWLDAHLPQLVERLVKAEIERVTRGQR
jgi:cell pole-organizing protein PopZ